MKTQCIPRCVLESTILFSTALVPNTFGQGALTPPGAPAPMMKTLQQVEPRTPISSAPYTISSPGSYYLTTNLVGTAGTNGITINSGSAILDLNGFALLGVPGSLNGVFVNGAYTNLTVRNGTISGWGSSGLDAYSSSARSVMLEQLNVCANGGNGLYAAAGSVVRNCCSASSYWYGISISGGVIFGCVARDNRLSGIDVAGAALVRDCQVENNGWDGIRAYSSTVRDCQAQNNSQAGIWAEASLVSGCCVAFNVQSGIFVNLAGSQIVGNNCYNNNTSGNVGHAGIYVQGDNNVVQDNLVSSSSHAGIQVVSPYHNNVVIRNIASGNSTTNYIISANTIVGPLITTTGTITNLNPWANFSY